MKRLFVTVTALSLALSAPAFAGSSVSIGVRIGDAPPPPAVVFHQQPRWVMAPRGGVYVVDDNQLDYDYFRYGGWHYVYNDGWWYRARRYRGPFVAIERRYVPRPIFMMSDRDYRWRHHPEGWRGTPSPTYRSWEQGGREQAGHDDGNRDHGNRDHDNGRGHH